MTGAVASRAYGLTLGAEFGLPHLAPSPAEPDCIVRFGDVANSLNAPVASGVDWDADVDRVRLSMSGVGRFLVEPHQIVVAAAPDATHAQLAWFVMQGCLAPLLHLRGRLVLHAAAVEVPGRGVVALAGQSASGKSTLVMACIRRGWRMVTDELCAIGFDAETARVAPGPPVIHLWREALGYFNVPADALRPVRPNLQKYEWPVGEVVGDLPLAAIVLLDPPARATELVRVQGAAALALLRAQVRVVRIAEAVRPAQVFSAAARLADRVPIFRLCRRDGAIEAVEELVDSLATLPS